MSRRTDIKEREWKTLRLLEIGGEYFAFQQQYALWNVERSRKITSGNSATLVPEDEHRLKPLDELVDLEDVADRAMGEEPVDSMQELTEVKQ